MSSASISNTAFKENHCEQAASDIWSHAIDDSAMESIQSTLNLYGLTFIQDSPMQLFAQQLAQINLESCSFVRRNELPDDTDELVQLSSFTIIDVREIRIENASWCSLSSDGCISIYNSEALNIPLSLIPMNSNFSFCRRESSGAALQITGLCVWSDKQSGFTGGRAAQARGAVMYHCNNPLSCRLNVSNCVLSNNFAGSSGGALVSEAHTIE